MSKKTLIIIAVIILAIIAIIMVIPWGEKKVTDTQNASQIHQQELNIDVITGKPIPNN